MLGIASIKNSEKNTPSLGVSGPIKNKKNFTMRLTNGRDIDYKRVAALKKEGNANFVKKSAKG